MTPAPRFSGGSARAAITGRQPDAFLGGDVSLRFAPRSASLIRQRARFMAGPDPFKLETRTRMVDRHSYRWKWRDDRAPRTRSAGVFAPRYGMT
jgi:hypothetical protein